MFDTIPQLTTFDEPALDAAFATLSTEVRTEAAVLSTPEAQEAFRLHWLGRKAGRLKLVSEAWLKAAPAEAKRPLGMRFNQLKSDIEAALANAKSELEGSGAEERRAAAIAHLNDVPHREQAKNEARRAAYEADLSTRFASLRWRSGGFPLDLTLPGTAPRPGTPHPLIETIHAIVKVFENLGYSVNLGPQVETDFYNFEALNFPPNHPARDTQDTLLVAHQAAKPSRDRLLMRTHTSPVQIRTMVEQAPPVRIVIPGKVHRNDAADATHSPIFHQVEGLAVDTDITFSDLKGTLDHAMKALFGPAVNTRFFPSFFPFTEPSADVQISCIFCGGSGCRKCKYSGWIELLGCGMVDPAVFAAVTAERIRLGVETEKGPHAYDPSRISGFAFGMGVERIAMILHGVADIGLFYSGDLRFLEQFA